MPGQIDDIKSRLDIVELVQSYIRLNKAGANYKALCPFHTEKTPSFNVSPARQIWHCFGCFPPGELIKTPFGYHAVETLGEGHVVVPGDSVYRKILATHQRRYVGDLIEIETRKIRRPIRLTGDHRVFAIRPPAKHEVRFKYFAKRYRRYLAYLSSEKPERYYRKIHKWLPIQEVEARSLRRGDLLLYPLNDRVTVVPAIDLNDYITSKHRFGPRPPSLPAVNVGEDFLRILGYWIAEGSSHRAYIRFSLGSHEEAFAQDIIALLRRVLGLTAAIHRRSGSKSGIEITACHAWLASAFKNLCGTGAAQKHIPFMFQELPPSMQRALLEAIFRGDGTQSVASKSTKTQRSITTISKVLSEQLIDILLRLGKFPSLTISGEKTDAKGVHHRTAFTVIWSEDATPKYNLVYYKVDGSRYWLLPIARMASSQYDGPVHNLTVETDHSYIASHIAVSNCGKGGDHFKFVMEIEGLEFREALELLAKRAGVQLRREDPRARSERARLHALVEDAAKIFESALHASRAPGTRISPQLAYLKERGLSDETIQAWRIGYAPDSWDFLLRALGAKGYRPEEAEKAGLAVRSEQGSRYDRFRNRIVFPISDASGRVVGFSGRIFDAAQMNADKTQMHADQRASASHQRESALGAKYINTPQTPIYDKSRVLYGFDRAKEEIRKQDAAVLVEGQMDVVLSHQAGVTNAVAVSGTALTPQQLRMLRRLSGTLVSSFDRDAAGEAATKRSLDLASAMGFERKVAALPPGIKDPAEAAAKDPAIWQKAVAEAKPIVQFFLETALARHDRQTAAGKRAIAAAVLPEVKILASEVEKAHWIQMLARELGVPEEALWRELGKAKPASREVLLPPEAEPEAEKNRRQQLESLLLGTLILHPAEGAGHLERLPRHAILNERHLRMLETIEAALRQNVREHDALMAAIPEEFREACQYLAFQAEVILERIEGIQERAQEMMVLMRELEREWARERLGALAASIREAETKGEAARVASLLGEFRQISEKLK